MSICRRARGRRRGASEHHVGGQSSGGERIVARVPTSSSCTRPRSLRVRSRTSFRTMSRLARTPFRNPASKRALVTSSVPKVESRIPSGVRRVRRKPVASPNLSLAQSQHLRRLAHCQGLPVNPLHCIQSLPLPLAHLLHPSFRLGGRTFSRSSDSCRHHACVHRRDSDTDVLRGQRAQCALTSSVFGVRLNSRARQGEDGNFRYPIVWLVSR